MNAQAEVDHEETRDPGTYVPCHLGIWTSPKTLGLARQLKKSKETVVGHLLQMLGHLQHHAPDGDLDGWSPLDLKAIANWRGKADVWVDALVAHGWMDREGDRLVPHDWRVYGGRGVVERASARERKRRSREKQRLAVTSGTVVPVPASVTPVMVPVTEPPVTPRDMSQAVTVTSRDVTPQVEVEVEAEERASRPVTVTVTGPVTPVTVTPPVTGVTPAASLSPGKPLQRAATVRKYASRLPHEQEYWRDNPAELLAGRDPNSRTGSFGERLQRACPALDGRNSRPQLLAVVTEKWESFEAKFFREGLPAFTALENWCLERNARFARSYAGDGGINIEAITKGIPRNLRPAPDPEDDEASP